MIKYALLVLDLFKIKIGIFRWSLVVGKGCMRNWYIEGFYEKNTQLEFTNWVSESHTKHLVSGNDWDKVAISPVVLRAPKI